MASNSVKKNVMLTLTVDEAEKIGRFMESKPYISLAKYIKVILLENILCQRAKMDEKNPSEKAPEIGI